MAVMVLDYPLAVRIVTITCQAPHAPWYHIPTGIFAILTGLAAAVMSLKEKPSWKWKGAWLLAIFSFTAIELRMIVWSDDNAAKEREYASCQVEKNFQTIETESQQQFRETISGVGQVFDKTKGAADTVSKAVNILTGGDSFAVLVVVAGQPIIEVMGNDPLHVVSFTMIDDIAYENYLRSTPNASLQQMLPFMTSFTEGEMPAHQGKIISIPPFTPHGTLVRYTINFFATNGTWTETYLQRNINGEWVKAIHVARSKGKRVVTLYEYIDPKYPRGLGGIVDWAPNP